MNKTFLFLVSAILLIGFVSATPLQEFMSSSDLTITMTQDSTTGVFSMNTAGLSFDNQVIQLPIPFNGYSTINVPISGILNGINLRMDLSDGSTFPVFSQVSISSTPSLEIFPEVLSSEKALLNLLLNQISTSTFTGEVTQDSQVLTNLALQTPLPVPVQGNSYFVKNGITYTFGYDGGFGNVQGYYKNQIGEAITRGVNSMNVQNVIEQNLLPSISLSDYLPVLQELGYSVSEIEFTNAVLENTDYDVSVNLNNLAFQDGTYQIPVTITPLTGDTTPITKTITLVLSGIVNEAGETTTSNTYVPSDFGVKQIINSIVGLPTGTLVEIQVSDVKPADVNTLSHTQGLKYLVIDTNGNQPTSGAAQISFSINKEGVNKDRINLYVWEGTSWTKLTTHYDGETATEYTYTATTPHFSIFMIGESTAFSRSSGGDGIVQNNSLQSVNNVKINNEVTPLSSETPTTTETPNNKGFFSFLTGAVTGLINSGAGVPAILFLMIVIAGTIVLVVVRRRGK